MLLTLPDTTNLLLQFQTYKLSGSQIPLNIIAEKYDDKPEVHPHEFYTALAHEVRNPLTNIILSVEMLESTEVSEHREDQCTY
jgi:signal transduction histidine kinase